MEPIIKVRYKEKQRNHLATALLLLLITVLAPAQAFTNGNAR